MLYTVKEVSEFTGVTIKTLHHYHKIGLLNPTKINEAGYRLYGEKELELLQQILFYRELDFSLKDIKKVLEDKPNRLKCLIEQQELLIARKQRIDCLLKTIGESIVLTKKGEIMNKSAMFQGLNKDEWEDALSKQNKYLKDKYNYNIPQIEDTQIDAMNEMAIEAQEFINSLSDALKNGWNANDERLQKTLERHITFLNSHGHNTNAKTFAAQAKFFIEDDFHRNMLEGKRIGLSYYLFAAAEIYADLN